MRQALLILLSLSCGFVPPARAAQATDNCTGVVTALPFTIGTPGNWCVASDLAYAQEPGDAGIKITVSDVVLDCNHRQLRGPGGAVTAYGILAFAADRVVVRRCQVADFSIGIFLQGTGNIVEDNRFVGSTVRGIFLQGGGNIVRRNLVLDSGGTPNPLKWAFGISVFGSTDVIDNTVTGVAATAGGGERAWGIYVSDHSSDTASMHVEGNRIRDVVGDGAGETVALGTYSPNGNTVLRNNLVVGSVGYGIRCLQATTKTAMTGNIVLGVPTPIQTCTDDGGNTSKN